MASRTPMWRRYLTLVRRDIRRDVREEVDFHIEARARELMAEGWPATEALAEASRLFGDATQVLEECHKIDARSEKRKRAYDHLADLAADIRYSFRQFRRQPKFWATIFLTLLIGISAGTTVFAIVDGVLLQPLSYREPDRLVHVTSATWKGIYYHLSERSSTLDLGGYTGGPEVTLRTNDGPIQILAATVSPGLFEVLGATPLLGRTFSPDEARPGSPTLTGSDGVRTHGVTMLSYASWQTYFGGRADAVGRSVNIDGASHTIVGVMPRGFDFPSRGTELWFPMSIEPSNDQNMWSGNGWTIIGRLRPGIELDSARLEVRSLIPTFADLFPVYFDMPDGYGTDAPVQSLHEQIVGSVRVELLVLLAAMGAVFLILCVNVANLLLARGIGRHRELSTRAALGAGRGRLIRQLIVENLTISIAAGAASMLVAFATLKILGSVLPADLPRVDQVQIDARVLLFGVAVSIVAGLVFGLFPALRVTRRRAALLTRGTGGVDHGPRDGRVSGIVVSLEISLALALVVSAALLVLSFWNLAQVDPGFRYAQVVTARIAPPSSPDALNADLLPVLREMPGATSAAIGTTVPFANDSFPLGFGIDGRVGSTDNPTFADVAVAITPDYLSALGIPLIEGRPFLETDRDGSMRVVMVSQSLARAFWGDESPIGERIQLPEAPALRTIVGVVGDVKWNDLSRASSRAIYVPLAQHNGFTNRRRIVIRTDADPELITGNLRAIVQSVDSDTPVSDIQTSSARVIRSVSRPRFAAYVVASFAGIAVLLAAVGISGILSYAMSRRIPEMGVRLALGATSKNVFALLFRHGLRLTLIGIGIGIPLALAASRSLSGLLFGVQPADTRILAFAIAVLLVVGLVASYSPAHRASRIDPTAAIRHD